MALNLLGNALRDVLDLVCATSDSGPAQRSYREACHWAMAWPIASGESSWR